MVFNQFHNLFLLSLFSIIIVTSARLAVLGGSHSEETTESYALHASVQGLQIKSALKHNEEKESIRRDIEKGLTFTRNVELIPNDASFAMNLNDDHCKQRDAYGDNECHYSWGEVVNGNYSVYISEQIESTDFMVGKATIDKFVPYEFKCPLCGEDCVLTIPVVHINLTIPMPRHCPIPVQTMQQQLRYRMWEHSPTDGVISTRIDGRVSVIQGSTGKTMASFTVEAYLK